MKYEIKAEQLEKIIDKQEELIKHYTTYYLPVNGVAYTKGISQIKKECKQFKSEIAALKEQKPTKAEQKPLITDFKGYEFYTWKTRVQP